MRATAIATALLMTAGLASAPAAVAADPALHFVTAEIPLRNARAGVDYQATVGGLALGKGTVRFRKTDGAPWVSVGADGTVTGRPPADAGGTASITVEAATAGEHTTAKVRIPVRPAGAPLVPEVKVLSFNLWYGGGKVDNGREKELKVLLDQNVDAVGLQEHMGTSAQELAKALGWYYHPGDNRVAIVSRYPIIAQETAPSPFPWAVLIPGFEDFAQSVAIKARIRLDEGQDITLWNTHQAAEAYGPWAACFGKWPEPLIIAEEALRGLHTKLTLDAMSADLAHKDRTPVLLTGDFNAPSHLDYTPATAEKHCGYTKIDWPSSVLAQRAGLLDSFRKAHPDPAAVPGNTWSPVAKTFRGGYGWDSHKGEPEPQDRIDFVYYAGGLTVLGSKALVAGTPHEEPDVSGNEWPSDHAAVLTTFRVQPR